MSPFEKTGKGWRFRGAEVMSDFVLNKAFRETVASLIAEAFSQVESSRPVREVRLVRTPYGVAVTAWPGKAGPGQLCGLFGQASAVMCDCGAVIGNNRKHPGKDCDWWTIYLIMER